MAHISAMTTAPSLHNLACIILAAGEGTRMRSSRAKVLHEVAGFPMITHVRRACESLSPQRIIAVLAPGADEVAAAVAPHGSVTQHDRRGTAHAVLAAKEALRDFTGRVLVVYGDTPLLQSQTLSALVGQKAPVSLLTFETSEPGHYGRVLVNDNGVADKIVEFSEATDNERAITLCNAGVMAFDSVVLWELLAEIAPHNNKKEFYLTDAVHLARAKGYNCGVVRCEMEEAQGVNSRIDLSVAESSFQKRLRKAVMEQGVTLRDPATIYFSADTRLGRDVVVGPHVVFGTGVEVEEGVEIHPYSHLSGVHVKKNARIGPFARLRPGSVVAEDAHIGNFVELKKARVDAGAKINHFSYIGDAHVGARTNIGAGTIICNYDGVHKHQTDIGDDVFIGSNSALVAPLSIGHGAAIAAGSVITENVPADAMAVARARQVTKPGWAKRWRERKRS